MFWFMILFVMEGLVLMAAAVPLLQRRVKPNPLYGFRLPKTLGDEAVWYETNAYGGRLLLRAGAVFTVAAVGLFFVPGLRNSVAAYTLLCTLVLVSALGAAVAFTLRYLHSL